MEEILYRRLTVHEVHAEHLDRQGLLPDVEMGEFRLQATYAVHHKEPWRISRFFVPEGYVDLRTRRRLRRRLQQQDQAEQQAAGEGDAADVKEVSEQANGGAPENAMASSIVDGEKSLVASVNRTLLMFNSPQRRIKLFTAMNAAVVPDFKFEIPEKDRWPSVSLKVYEDGTDVVFGESPQLVDAEAVWADPNPRISNNSEAGTREAPPAEVSFEPSSEVLEQYRTEVSAKQHTSSVFKQALRGAFPDTAMYSRFDGRRGENCSSADVTAEMCVGDVGVAISVYETERYKVIVFHPSFTVDERNYILWYNKIRLIEFFKEELFNMYTSNTGQRETPDMLRRAGGMALRKEGFIERQEWATAEMKYRCAFLKEAYEPLNDTKGMATYLGGLGEALEEEGPWLLVKMVLRVIFPESRPRLEKEIYLTGTGTGGANAALASMWFQRVDEREYTTILIAPVGWQCLARKYPGDMAPWLQPKWITVYAHVLDAYANAMDPVAGQVCMYGLHDVMREGSPTALYCERMIGHTAAELFYRPKQEDTNPEAEQGRLAFDACHYFTHSIWYAARLFEDDATLRVDATTDGGCREVPVIKQDDAFNRCPAKARAEIDCDVLEDSSQALPVNTIFYIASGLVSFIVLVAALLYFAMWRAQDKSWAYRSRELLSKPKVYCPCVRWIVDALSDSNDRGGKARTRAQERRERMNQERQDKKKHKRGANDSGGLWDAKSYFQALGLSKEEEVAEGPKDQKDKKNKKDKKDKKEKKDRKEKSDRMGENGNPDATGNAKPQEDDKLLAVEAASVAPSDVAEDLSKEATNKDAEEQQHGPEKAPDEPESPKDKDKKEKKDKKDKKEKNKQEGQKG